MALLWMANCGDHCTPATEFGASAGAPTTITGRTGNGVRVDDQDGLIKVFETDSGSATVVLGFAFMLNGTSDVHNFVSFSENSTNHLQFRMNSSRQWRVYRAATTLIGTGTFQYVAGVWYYVEIKVKIDDTVGTVEVRHDGVVDFTLTGQDTRNGVNAAVDQLSFGPSSGGSSVSFNFDDVYFLDDTGSAPNNDFLGDCKVETKFPNGNGNSSQFDGSDGNQTDNYLLVDETTPDSDTTYVESPDVNDKDTYLYQDMTVGAGTVYGVLINPLVRKSDAGERTFKTVARLSATEVDGPSQILSNTYRYMGDIRETKPGGGTWSITDVNNAEFGVKVNS